ncbi:rod shape determining protein RodA [Natranaerovirga hydrolytica]|uniref:Rod shape determining protein RodA n=1 Tax=Natranaerovirga hydrolytica TaxID=680378 RepID=A0A4R1N637_9FIRM|nr:FtsW/RodA/SpoVE family cell cycle protein [Natranaerovirga hydrolytica]TCK98093.1 rod shape determining protein RodA [Natranaerovirga hydrolytica]
MFRNYDFRRYDFLLALLVIGVAIFGIIAISSASEDEFYKRQILGLLLGIIAMVVMSLIDYKLIGKFYWVIYFVNIGLLLYVLAFGHTVNNATRWINLEFINIQPSEFSKIFMTIFIAVYLHKNKDRINNFIVLIGLGVLVAIPTFLISQQPDLSTSLVLMFILVMMIFVAGINYKYILIALGLLIPAVITLFWYVEQPDQRLLEDYQVRRIMSIRYPEDYLLEEGWQQFNSISAIGSGQLHGKGIASGEVTSVNNANYLSEPQTDFIFAIIGEELGFIGTSLLLIVLLTILLKCILIAKDATDMYGVLIVVGVVSIILFQTFVNVGVATALLPNTGIPLPFVSYGISSLVSTMMGIGIILNISMQRKSLFKRG